MFASERLYLCFPGTDYSALESKQVHIIVVRRARTRGLPFFLNCIYWLEAIESN